MFLTNLLQPVTLSAKLRLQSTVDCRRSGQTIHQEGDNCRDTTINVIGAKNGKIDGQETRAGTPPLSFDHQNNLVRSLAKISVNNKFNNYVT